MLPIHSPAKDVAYNNAVNSPELTVTVAKFTAVANATDATHIKITAVNEDGTKAKISATAPMDTVTIDSDGATTGTITIQKGTAKPGMLTITAMQGTGDDAKMDEMQIKVVEPDITFRDLPADPDNSKPSLSL